MEASLIRFLTCDLKLLEIDSEEASASLTQAFEDRFGRRPSYDETTSDACTGIYLPSDGSDDGQVMVQRRANGRGVRRALWLLAAKHSLEGIRLVTQPQGTSSIRDDEWEFVEPRPHDQSKVTVWPIEPSWPIRDRVVIAYSNTSDLRLVHRARRNPQCDWCVPAQTTAEALSFASVERAEAWIAKHGATERHPLEPRYRSVAASLVDELRHRRPAG